MLAIAAAVAGGRVFVGGLALLVVAFNIVLQLAGASPPAAARACGLLLLLLSGQMWPGRSG